MTERYKPARTIVLLAMILFSAVAGVRASSAKPAILCYAGDRGQLQPEFARWVAANGFELQWGEPTRERLRTVNVLVLVDGKPGKYLKDIVDYVSRGGGLFIGSEVRRDPGKGLPSQYPLLDAVGLRAYPEAISDAQMKTAGPGKFGYAYTTRIAKSPVTDGVCDVWFPVGTPDGSIATLPLEFSPEWQAVVSAAATATARKVQGADAVPPERRRGGVAEPLAICGIRSFGKGRIVACGVQSSFLFSSGFSPVLGRVVLDRGIDDTPSHFGVLLLNSLRWLTAASLGKPDFGGATTDERLLALPGPVQEVPFRDWSAVKPEAQRPNWHGVIGARTNLSVGKASVGDYVAAAKKANLHFIVFLESFPALTKEKFAVLQKECERYTDDTFQAYPGFTIQDVHGDNYFICGPKTLWPEKSLLDDTGTRFTGAFQEGGKVSRPGSIAPTLLGYSFKSGCFTTGTYLHKKNRVPYHAFCAYDSIAVVTQQNGKILESFDEMLPSYQHMVNRSEHLRPMAVTLMDAPDDLQYVQKGIYYHTVIESDTLKDIGKQFTGIDERCTYPPYDRTIQVTNGPVVTDWHYVGNYDWRDYTPWDWYRWDHCRWQMRLHVESASPLAEVRILDGAAPFRRFLPEGRTSFRWESALNHNQQRNLWVLATDGEGRRTLTTELFNHVHPFEEYVNDMHRTDIVSWGKFQWPDTQQHGQVTITSGSFSKGPFNLGRLDPLPYGPDSRPGLLDVWGFGSLPVTATPTIALVPTVEAAQGSECMNWGQGKTDQVLHCIDTHIGTIASDGLYAEKWREGPMTIFDTIAPVTPTQLIDTAATRQVWNVGQAGNGMAMRIDITITAKQDLDLKRLSLGRSPLPAAVRQATELPTAPSPQRKYQLRTPEDYFFYAGTLNSVAVFNLGQQPVVYHDGDLILPVARLRKGEQVTVRLLAIGVPFMGGTDTRWVEDVRVRMGLTPLRPAYSLEVDGGEVQSQRYAVVVDGQQRGFSATVTRDKAYPVPLPIQVTNLNPRWTVAYLDLENRKYRPVGMTDDGIANVVHDFGTAQKRIFIGHPVTCDHPALFLTVTQMGPTAFRVETHNPTDKPVQAVVTPSRSCPILKGKAVTVHLQPGSSTMLEFGEHEGRS